jgi:uncharacterized protein
VLKLASSTHPRTRRAMPNRLANETSPYLLQHAHNPVDWYPWGEQALARARDENKPILLSIGYAACHWCHVMERESFEDETTAQLMNEQFVSIKVDREERPDLDAVYMQAVQAMTGHGGWPMTVFLTPDGSPFYGGTYFPPEDRQGMPSFRRVMGAVAEAWRERPEQVSRSAAQMRELYERTAQRAVSQGALDASLLDRAARVLAGSFDERHAGFGRAPKFPPTMALDFLLRHWARTGNESSLAMAHRTFVAMARGGMYDQVGGGFARYSVDAQWLVPHFEKMLYDNALLARFGVQLWQATHDDEVRRVTRDTFRWVEREMTSPEGGFYSSLDADSEGHEGLFYLWSEAQLDEALGEDAAIARAYWGVTPAGNFEGRNILYVPNPPSAVAARLGTSEEALQAHIAHAMGVLYALRARRIWPGRDEKVLASWNGLMLRAIAEGARVFGDAELRALALRAAEMLWRTLVRGAGDGTRVMRVHKDGVTRVGGFLEDHASMGLAALAVYELTFDVQWLRRARDLASATIAHFWSEEHGAFFDTAHDQEALVARPRDPTDNAVPAGSSLIADLMARLGDVLGDVEMTRRATWLLETEAESMVRYPQAFGHALGVADMLIHGATELAVVGAPDSMEFRALLSAAANEYVPALVIAGGPPDRAEDVPLLADRPMRDGRATAYVCRHYACDTPVTDPEQLVAQLRNLRALPLARSS